MRALLSRLPEHVKRPLRRAWRYVSAIPDAGTGRFCPVCERSARRFRPFGAVPRTDAECPWCGSLERHRLVWLYLTARTDLLTGAPRSVLHVAPEPCLEARFRTVLGGGYLTADLSDSRAMVRMDLMKIERPDASFDVVYCSHVLEHVVDDRLAMRELRRVLRPDGWAILLVPITAETTFEDPAIVDAQARLAAFGQVDHVRRYGPDYVSRLRDAGFDVTVYHVSDLVSPDAARRMGLTPASGEIYHCGRAPGAAATRADLAP